MDTKSDVEVGCVKVGVGSSCTKKEDSGFDSRKNLW